VLWMWCLCISTAVAFWIAKFKQVIPSLQAFSIASWTSFSVCLLLARRLQIISNTALVHTPDNGHCNMNGFPKTCSIHMSYNASYMLHLWLLIPSLYWCWKMLPCACGSISWHQVSALEHTMLRISTMNCAAEWP
jgi:hypothetical protein